MGTDLREAVAAILEEAANDGLYFEDKRMYWADRIIALSATSATPAGLGALARRFLDATEACRLASEGAIQEKGAAVAFEEGYDPLSLALDEFAAAEAALRDAVSPRTEASDE